MLKFCKIAARPTIPMVYFPHRSPFASRSLLDCFSIGSRSVLDRSSIVSRSSSVHSPFGDRRSIEDRSKNDRRNIGESSEARRRCIETLMGNHGEDDPNKKIIFNHLNSICYGKTYSWLHHFAPLHSVYWKSMSYVKIRDDFWWRIDEARIAIAAAILC